MPWATKSNMNERIRNGTDPSLTFLPFSYYYWAFKVQIDERQRTALVSIFVFAA